MAWKVEEAALRSHSVKQLCGALLTAQGQLRQQLHFLIILGMKETPQTAWWRAEMC